MTKSDRLKLQLSPRGNFAGHIARVTGIDDLLNRMVDSPVYRWLPAKSKIPTRFLLYHAKSPEGMTRVDDVRLENGMLIVEDRAAGKTMTLAASRPL